MEGLVWFGIRNEMLRTCLLKEGGKDSTAPVICHVIHRNLTITPFQLILAERSQSCAVGTHARSIELCVPRSSQMIFGKIAYHPFNKKD